MRTITSPICCSRTNAPFSARGLACRSFTSGRVDLLLPQGKRKRIQASHIFHREFHSAKQTHKQFQQNEANKRQNTRDETRKTRTGNDRKLLPGEQKKNRNFSSLDAPARPPNKQWSCFSDSADGIFLHVTSPHELLLTLKRFRCSRCLIFPHREGIGIAPGEMSVGKMVRKVAPGEKRGD